MPDIINYYNRADTILLAVNSGVGLAILPPQLIGFYSCPNVVALPIDGTDALVSSIVALNKGGGNPEVQKFMNLNSLSEIRGA